MIYTGTHLLRVLGRPNDRASVHRWADRLGHDLPGAGYAHAFDRAELLTVLALERGHLDDHYERAMLRDLVLAMRANEIDPLRWLVIYATIHQGARTIHVAGYHGDEHGLARVARNRPVHLIDFDRLTAELEEVLAPC